MDGRVPNWNSSWHALCTSVVVLYVCHRVRQLTRRSNRYSYRGFQFDFSVIAEVCRPFAECLKNVFRLIAGSFCSLQQDQKRRICFIHLVSQLITGCDSPPTSSPCHTHLISYRLRSASTYQEGSAWRGHQDLRDPLPVWKRLLVLVPSQGT